MFLGDDRAHFGSGDEKMETCDTGDSTILTLHLREEIFALRLAHRKLIPRARMSVISVVDESLI